ncbi:hypothetical protein G7Y89_g5722 [Cudoniella acicularis]|uniref:Ricin B lectin domain-containing protein n=1 Tax=Cudoniella acicularis TaxID=354080 RepID=A0A8H4RLX3_9HELO|nr:hypothetical protein G7Y89_g5722 [Cudoniella acicularis]
MIASISLLFSALVLASASPIEVRTVAALNTAAFEEAQQRDDTATRAFSSTEIKTSTGECLFVNELSGDFRANLNPIQVAACDGSAGQLWDIITKGKHDDQAGTMLVVNTLTQACMNFDPRRAAGNTVIMFSCGGRGDGGGAVTNSQLFNFTGGAGPLSLEPENAVGTCLAVTAGNVLDQAPCKAGDATQSFSFGGGSPAPASAVPTQASAAPASSAAQVSSAVSVPTSAQAVASSSASSPAVAATSIASSAAASSPSTEAPATTSAAQAAATSTPSSTGPISVSRAGGVLNPSAAAEANPIDNTAVRAFTSASIKSSTGDCLFINPDAGDFRENLIPIAVQPCTGAAGEKFDFIMKGVHNNVANSTLVVSSLTNGCLNFDSRRAVGDTVIMFSCGGRADGGGAVTNSQLFAFGGGNSIVLAPENANGATCLFDNAGKLDSQACNGGATQVFSIVP